MTNLNTIPAEESTLLNKPMSATSAELTMVPKSCVYGNWGKCNPPNGDKVVGAYDGTYWTRV